MYYVITNKQEVGYELYHYGVLGQKWGIRRYQNKDGTLTAAGKKKYGADSYDKIPEHGSKRKKFGKKSYVLAMKALKVKRQRENYQKHFIDKKMAKATTKEEKKVLKAKTDRNKKLIKTLDAEYKENLANLRRYGSKRTVKKVNKVYDKGKKKGWSNEKIEKKLNFKRNYLSSPTAVDAILNTVSITSPIGIATTAVKYKMNQTYANQILNQRMSDFKSK